MPEGKYNLSSMPLHGTTHVSVANCVASCRIFLGLARNGRCNGNCFDSNSLLLYSGTVCGMYSTWPAIPALMRLRHTMQTLLFGALDRAHASLDAGRPALGVLRALYLCAGLRHHPDHELDGLSGRTLRRAGSQTPVTLYYEWPLDRYGHRWCGGGVVRAADWRCEHSLA